MVSSETLVSLSRPTYDLPHIMSLTPTNRWTGGRGRDTLPFPTLLSKPNSHRLDMAFGRAMVTDPTLNNWTVTAPRLFFWEWLPCCSVRPLLIYPFSSFRLDPNNCVSCFPYLLVTGAWRLLVGAWPSQSDIFVGVGWGFTFDKP